MRKRLMTGLLPLVLLLLTVLAAGAHGLDGDHGQGDTAEHHAQSEHHAGGQHSARSMHDGDMAMLGSQVSKGVRGMAHIKDVHQTMSELGMASTHHAMIMFIDEASGEPVTEGTVALKVTAPNAKVWETIELVGMDGHFGADLALDKPGEYHFKFGTRLADGVNRKFHFHFVNP